MDVGDEKSAAVEATPEPADRFPIVGVGASAGGLAAFEAFFSGMPDGADPGMAFVLVQHLSPDHESLLTELVSRYTRMQVFEIKDGMRVQINCAYIIPPNHDLALLDGALHLLEPSEPRGRRLPIDFFLRSLAQDQHERACGVVLSGTGSDGAMGVRAIRAEGGLVMAEKLEASDFDGMPSSAIATGMVDFVLPANEMAAQLVLWASRARDQTLNAPAGLDEALPKICVLLRDQTHHDFSQYKPGTLSRRIQRRMTVQQIGTVSAYLKFLQQAPQEVDALFHDLLIGVTHFFRDREAFAALEEQVIPRLFENRPEGSAFRVWSAGCSTGEEAYSLAILLRERMEALKQNYKLQVFATDIDLQAIATARAGLYPASIAADLTPERLARFFTAEPNGHAYRVHKSIRDLVVFSEQDLIRDPPFSRMDLISCRNLLIYLNADLQKRIIPLFHYALNTHGVLFLGTSEGVGESAERFEVVDRRAKLFQRQGAPRTAQGAPVGRFRPPASGFTLGQAAGKSASLPEKRSLRALTEQALLRQMAPAAALVDRSGDIRYLHGRTGPFLELLPGEPTVNNILKMAREGLRPSLGTALHRAAGTLQPVQVQRVRVKTNAHFSDVNLSIYPVTDRALDASEAPLFLVVLEEEPPAPPTTGLQPDGAARIAALEEELRSRDEYIQSTQEELETSNEELRSSSEGAQSMNEELQASNEELATSKEELQSVNEELATVNAELTIKVIDLSRANNDMNNLLAGTGIATVFVDRQLRILRFTPTAAEVIHLIPSDVGRPVGHLGSTLVGYDRLVADVQRVLETLAPRDEQVQTTDGRWFSMGVRPYRTLDNVIEGAVLTFVDVTEHRKNEESLRKANELLRLAVVVRDAHDAITVQDLEGRTLAWNPGATRMYGWTEAEALSMNVRERIPQPRQEHALTQLKDLSRAEVLAPFRTQRLTRSGAVVEVWMTATALFQNGQMYAIATTERAAKPSEEEKP